MTDGRDRASHMVRGSILIMAVVAVQVAANAVYWLVAARRFDSDDIGAAGGAFSALQFVVFAAGLGLTVTNARFGAAGGRDADALLSWSLLAAAVGVCLSGTVFLVSPAGAEARDVAGGGAGMMLFVVLAVGAAIALLIDVRITAARRYGVLLARGGLVGAARIPLLFVDPPVDRPWWLFLLAAAPTALYGIAGMAALRRLIGAQLHLRPLPTGARRIARFAAVNWGATLTLEAPQFALPVIVLHHVTETPYANFFYAWGATLAVFLLPAAIAQVSLLEGAKDQPDTHRRANEAMVAALGIAVAASVAAFVGRDLMVTLYGDAYGEAARILPRLVVAGIPWAITSILLSEARIRRDHATTVAITTSIGFGIIGAALVLVPDHGIDGAVTAWIAGNVLAAVAGVAATLRSRHPDARLPLLHRHPAP